MWLTDFAVDYPGFSLCLCYGFLIVFAVLTAHFDLYVMSHDSFRDYLVWNNLNVYNMDMHDLLMTHVERYGGSGEIKSLQHRTKHSG